MGSEILRAQSGVTRFEFLTASTRAWVIAPEFCFRNVSIASHIFPAALDSLKGRAFRQRNGSISLDVRGGEVDLVFVGAMNFKAHPVHRFLRRRERSHLRLLKVFPKPEDECGISRSHQGLDGLKRLPLMEPPTAL